MADSILISGTSGECIEFTPGTFVGTGAITIAAIVKPDPTTLDNASTRFIVGFTTAGSPGGMGSEGNPSHWFFYDSTGPNAGPNVPAANEWYLYAVSKSAGNVTLRHHVYRYSTLAWTHTDAGASNNLPAPTVVQLGAMDSEEYDGGNILVVGVWDSVLSDGTIQTLPYNKTAWTAASPKEAWRLDSLTPDNFVGTSTQGITFGTPTLDVGDAPAGWSDFATGGQKPNVRHAPGTGLW